MSAFTVRLLPVQQPAVATRIGRFLPDPQLGAAHSLVSLLPAAYRLHARAAHLPKCYGCPLLVGVASSPAAPNSVRGSSSLKSDQRGVDIGPLRPTA